MSNLSNCEQGLGWGYSEIMMDFPHFFHRPSASYCDLTSRMMMIKLKRGESDEYIFNNIHEHFFSQEV